MKKKLIVILLLFLLIGVIFITTKNYGKKIINSLPISISLPLKNLLKENVKKNARRISNDYNEVFLHQLNFF